VIAIPIIYAWVMLALSMWAWKHSMDVWSDAWAYFVLILMLPATAIGTTVLAAWLS